MDGMGHEETEVFLFFFFKFYIMDYSWTEVISNLAGTKT